MLIRTILTILLLMLMGAPALTGKLAAVNAQTVQKQPAKVKRYACPMHPAVTSTRARKCPKCGMTLRVVKEAATTPAPTPTPLTPVPTESQPAAAAEPPSFSSALIPDVDVYDQNGKRLKFRSDLIKGKTVAINFIFTTCTTICPPLTATFRRVQQELIAQKLSVELISISVDPTTDTPERLREFAAKFKAGPGWTFVTGDQAAIDSILQALGSSVANKNDHTPMVLLGNDVSGYWTRAYGLSSPASLLKAIAEAANRK